MPLQFLYFLINGGIAALLNWGSRFLFSLIFPFELSVILAFAVGLFSGFFLMRLFVFKNKSNTSLLQFRNYFIVNIFGLFQTLLISIVGVKWVFMSINNSEAIAHFFGVFIPAFTSYLGHKFFTFK